jgi:hypothetical protein
MKVVMTDIQIINANGIWQSILKWEKIEGLDVYQQMTFEILATTYVLTVSVSFKELQTGKMYNNWVHAVQMESVEYIKVEWQDCDHFVGKFWLKPKIGTFRVKYPISKFWAKSCIQTNIELQHLPVIMNHTITGHKLQGKTLTSLVIAEWSRVKNWA